MGCRSAGTLRAAEEVGGFAAEDVGCDVAVDGGRIVATIELILIAVAAFDNRDDIADDFCLVVATEHIVDVIIATSASCTIIGVFVGNLQVDVVDDTIVVAAAIHFLDDTGVDSGRGRTMDVGEGLRTVTTTEHAVEASAVDDDRVVGRFHVGTDVGCVRTAIEVLDGVFAIVDVHRGRSGHGCSGRRLVGCVTGLVATAEHLLDGVFLWPRGVGVSSMDIRKQRIHSPTSIRSVRNHILFRMCRMINVHIDIAVRRAVVVVGAEDAAEDGGAHVVGSACLCRATNVQLHIARGCVAVAAQVGVGSAAIDIDDGAAQDVD